MSKRVFIRPQATRHVIIRTANTRKTAITRVVRQVVRSSARQGPAGPGDKHYVHDQMSASASWTVPHNLGKFPAITVVDSSGNVVEGNIQHIDTQQAILTFTGAFAGKAYCN